MKEPFCSEEEFLASVRENLDSGENFLNVWWLGQSGFLIENAGHFLLIDPYLSDSLTKKYANTDKPHTPIMRRLVAPERLDFIDVVSSSHNHTDHLDPETLRPLFAANPNLSFVAGKANRMEAATRGGIALVRVLGVDDGTTVQVKGFRFTGIPAAHNTIERDEHGHCRFLGYVIECGPWKIYHSGDTLVYEGLADTLKKLGPIDLALLPINGDRPERRVAGNMDGIEAARLASDAGVYLVCPCHYDMFEFNTASPGDFSAECNRLGVLHSVMLAGKKLWLEKGIDYPCRNLD